MSRLNMVDPVWRKEDLANYFGVTVTTVDNWKRDQSKTPRLPDYDVNISGRVKGWHLSTLINSGWPIKIRESADVI